MLLIRFHMGGFPATQRYKLYPFTYFEIEHFVLFCHLHVNTALKGTKYDTDKQNMLSGWWVYSI